MPAAYFHPWLDEVALGLRNRVADARARLGETLFALVGWSLLGAGAGWAWSHVDGDRFGVVLETMARHPLPIGVVVAALAAGVVRASVLGLRHALADGWWSALAIPASATRRTAVLAGVATALGLGALLAAPLGAVALVADHPQRWLGAWLATLAAGGAAGGAAGLALALRAPLEKPAQAARGRGTPLLPLAALLERGALGEVARWQRIAGLRRWRAGGGAWQLGVFVLLIPANEARVTLAGLLLLGLALVWATVTLRAALDVAARYGELSAALPRRFGALARATARYPAAIVAATGAWLVLALALQDAPPGFLVGAPLVLAALVLHELALTWRYPRAVARARRRFAVELVLVVGVAQALAAVALAVYAALVVHHLLKARTAR
jgi:hypothetical protein